MGRVRLGKFVNLLTQTQPNPSKKKKKEEKSNLTSANLSVDVAKQASRANRVCGSIGSRVKTGYFLNGPIGLQVNRVVS